MSCSIFHPATAAAVITDKLGGSVPNVTTYTLISNIVAAIAVPILFPLIEPHEGVSFLGAFSIILWKVFTLLICPFLLAVLVRWALPRTHGWLVKRSGAAFTFWLDAFLFSRA